MKKIIFILSLFFLSLVFIQNIVAKDKKFSVELGAGVRGIAAEHFSSIYSGTNICYSADIAYKLFSFGEVFLHSDYIDLKGETDYTKETTTFKMTPVEFGFRALFGKNKLLPYIGIGGGSYSYEDMHPGLLTISESNMGFFGEGGLKFYLTKSIFIDMKAKYIVLKSDNDVDLGGFTFIGGVGFSI